MELRNLLEDSVLYGVNKLMDEREDICKCNKCKLDIAAVALNNLPPKYVVTEAGGLYGRVNNLNYQFETDIIMAVAKAMDIVSKNPKHE
jgi:competence protein ComFB